MAFWDDSEKWRRRKALTYGELAGYAAGLVASFFIDVFAGPKKAFDVWLGKTLILPHLDWFTKTFRAFTPELRRGKERAAQMTPEERAAYIAGGITSVGTTNLVGFAASLLGQKHFERRLGVSTSDESKLLSLAVDGGVHLGSMLVQSTALAEHSENTKRKISSILQKTVGFSKRHADNLAFTTVYFGPPELMGTLGRAAGQWVGNRI